jgi:hypothetical protein
VFAGAPKEIMVATLQWVRNMYHGSVCPGYMNTIGFDRAWQNRFRYATGNERVDTDSTTTIRNIGTVDDNATQWSNLSRL